MLRHAREAAGLSQAELARQLNLGARIVDVMEQENLHALPGAVYVQGYLRKWADYLQLDEQQLQQAYTRLAGEQRASDMRHITPIEPMRMKKAESSFPWFRLLFFIGILGLGIFSTRFLPESMRLVDTNQDSALPNSMTGSQTASTIAPGLPSIPLMPPIESGSAVQVVAPTPGIVVGESITTTEPANAMNTTPTINSAPIAPPTPQGLELNGQGNAQGSWVRVKDADGRVLYEGTLAPGNSKKLDGKRPFEITIGRASDLQVMLDGSLIDLKAYARAGDKAFIPKLGTAPSQ
ncbi:MAG: hypothetical protein B7Y40_05860 [Gammaproteobacteria bacterium 28-57-27]|nr:MAG: hypothetical protein B7Y40_05860 [Gammaproteobacteria bacterium 28-57-27]